MSSVPDLLGPIGAEVPAVGDVDRTLISLAGLDYVKARAIPGAVYSSEHKAMVLPAVTARAAIVALQLFPNLGSDYPELIEARDQQLQDVSPTDYATQLGIEIDAPNVHASLVADGHDWLTFPGNDGPTQSTDLGYAAAVLEQHGAFYLGWARGYGKTLGTAAIIEHNEYRQVLIAVPNTTKVDTWVRELEKRLPTHTLVVYPDSSVSGYQAKQDRILVRCQALAAVDERFVLLVHHEGLASVAKKAVKSKPLDGWRRLKITWDLFAVDEAHRLKNTSTLTHRAAMKVPHRKALALSGSVYENSWEELFGVLNWMYPGRYSNHWRDWNLRFLDYVEGYGKICVGILPGKEQAMRDEIGVFMVVREKPDRSDAKTILVDLSPEQRRAYDELQEHYATRLQDDTTIVAEAGVVMLGRLRQLATGLELLSDRVADSSKLDAATQLIMDSPDDDFFVACWYKASAYALRDRLIAQAYSPFVVTGDVPMKQRTAIISHSREQAASKHPGMMSTVMIGTIPTLGESVNLQHLNHVIRLDRSFNPALNRQIVDRCDRTGQERQVYLTDIVARDTVDELVVMPNLANKDAFRAMILGRGA